MKHKFYWLIGLSIVLLFAGGTSSYLTEQIVIPETGKTPAAHPDGDERMSEDSSVGRAMLDQERSAHPAEQF